MAPARCDRSGTIHREPYVVGPYADKIISFFVGAFAPVVALFPTAVAMFVWARTDDEYERGRRRRHAASVTMWCGVGSLLMIALVAAILLALISAAARLPLATPSASILP
jgi:uncharacterized membrane protein YidH (DUF202 family)